MDWLRVEYGPWTGCNTSLQRHKVPRDRVTGESCDFRLTPYDGRWVRRKGLSIQAEASYPSIAGMLEAKWSATARQVLDFETASITTGTEAGYRTWGVLWTKESTNKGTFAWRDPNTGYTYNALGRQYGTTHYPQTAAQGAEQASNYEHKWHNLWCEDGTQKLLRGTSSTQRQFVTPGSRRAVSVNRGLHFPNLQGTPLHWYDRRYNASSVGGTEPERVHVWGRIPPLWCPRFVTANLPTATTSVRQWKEGEAFYASIQFVFEDGSVSQPFVSQAKTSIAAVSGEYGNYCGYVQVPSTTGSTDYFEYIQWDSIPIGPPGCIGRRLLRSEKADTGSGETPALDLFVCGYIPNNTSTAYKDYNGDDAALVPQESTPDVHFRHAWPKRGRYAWEFDGRVAVGYLKDNPAAIVLCPTGNNTALRAINRNDESTVTAGYHFFRIVGTSLQLRYDADGDAAGALGTTTITLTAAKTVQDIVDEINATYNTSAGAPPTTGGEWAAQVAPGADGQAASTNLCVTDAIDHGDDSSLTAGGTTGNVRAWSNAWPGIIYFDHTYLSGLPSYKTRFMHTEGGPELRSTGSYGSAFPFAVGPAWDIKPPEDAGILMGGRQLADGCVVFYSKAVYLYRNTRGGRTGQDLDYRLDKISSRGCISWASITGGNNWVGWLSTDGFFVTDGQPNNEHCLTYDHYLSGSGTGDLTYEIAECAKLAGSDSDGEVLHATVIGDALYLSYRSAAATYRVLEYDFSATAGASGLSQVLTPDGTPYGWSTPWKVAIGPLGSVRASTGIIKVGVYRESSSGYVTGDGRVDAWDTGTTDNGVAMSPLLYLPVDDFGTSAKKRMRWMFFKHKTPTSASWSVALNRNRARTSYTTYAAHLSINHAGQFWTDNVRVQLDGTTPSEVYEIVLTDGGGGTTAELHGVACEVRALKARP